MDKKTCYYIVDGQSRLLKRLHSARLVVPARNFHHSHVAARLSRSSRLAMATEVPKNTLIVRGEPNKLEEIRRYRDVHRTRSAFLDENGYELFLTDEVLVHFAHTTHDAARRELCRQFNCLVVDDTKATWRIRVVDTDEDAPLDVANALAQVPEVDFAEPNALQSATYAALAPPSDTLFQNQWHLHNTGQGGGAEGADVKALAAWDMTTGSADIRVVVYDSGVDIRHPDLQANINPGKDFDNDDDDASNNSGPRGTACAGVIAAVGNNEGVIGVAPGCRIVPLRAAGAHTWDTWAETFEWAAQLGDIISCSWSISRNSTLTEAIQKAAREGRNGKGIAIFFATGNGFINSIAYPASLPETIAIGASTNIDVRAIYSQFGDGIDFVAPSSGGILRIETTDIRGAFGYNSQTNGDYCKAADATGFGGTSSATPLAAGVAALMLSVNPNLIAEQVRAIMRDTCDKIDDANANYDARGWSDQYGYGRVNAAAAVQRAQDLLKPSKGNFV